MNHFINQLSGGLTQHCYTRTVTFSLCALLFSPISIAKDNTNTANWYIGGQFGYAATDISSGSIDDLYSAAGVSASNFSIKDSDLGGAAFLGYKFNHIFSAEAGYMDLGNRHVKFTGETTDIDAFYDLAEHVYPETGKGLNLSLIASMELVNDISVSGKVGYFDWKRDYSTAEIDTSDQTSTNVGSAKQSGNSIWFGAELNYQLNNDIQLFLSYQHIPIDRDTVQFTSIGLRYWLFSNDPEPTNNQLASTLAEPKLKPEPEPEPEPMVDTDKDGVADSMDQCKGTPLTHFTDEFGCTQQVEELAEMGLVIYYQNDSAIIDNEDYTKVQEMADFINKHQIKTLTITGHTSAVGGSSYNQKLSVKRAESVSDRLHEQFEIPKEIMSIVGKGESELISNIADKNRRVEIYLKEVITQPRLK